MGRPGRTDMADQEGINPSLPGRGRAADRNHAARGSCGKIGIVFATRHYDRRGTRTKTVVRSGGSRPRAAPLIRPSGREAAAGIT